MQGQHDLEEYLVTGQACKLESLSLKYIMSLNESKSLECMGESMSSVTGVPS